MKNTANERKNMFRMLLLLSSIMAIDGLSLLIPSWVSEVKLFSLIFLIPTVFLVGCTIYNRVINRDAKKNILFIDNKELFTKDNSHVLTKVNKKTKGLITKKDEITVNDIDIFSYRSVKRVIENSKPKTKVRKIR